jgi:ribose transport system ATP-binding protein
MSTLSQGAPLLTMSGVSKRFGATHALDNVSLSVGPGQVHALIGENGAGKSTLMKVLSGVHRADAGEMTLSGTRYAPAGPADALARGVAMIYQELNLAPHLTVEANITLGQERTIGGWLRKGKLQARARAALARLAADDLPLDAVVGDLTIGDQQRVEIARALASRARVIVFDEPTSSLTEQDSQRLFQVIRELRQSGLAIVYISHFLEELAQISDVYTVLRDGKVVGAGRLTDVTLDQLIRMMVGRELTEMFPKTPRQPGDVVLTLDRLSAHPQPREATLDLRRGEILGIAGLVGAGRSELVRAIFGLARVTSGTVRVVHVGRVGRSPKDSIRKGLGLVSEDRKHEGLALDLSIADNLTLSRLVPYRRFGLLDLRRRRAVVEDWMRDIGCRALGANQTVGELSGGNQQKIAIARLLHQQADVLLFDEPTRGIDVGTKAEIYRLLGKLAAAGKAIILISSYLPELLGVADRIAVMCRGRIVDLRPTEQWTEDAIMHSATRGITTGTIQTP